MPLNIGAVSRIIPLLSIQQVKNICQRRKKSHSHTDWKAAKLLSPPGVTMGNDFAGTICAVGPGGDESHIGRRVAGFITGSRDDKYGGAFAEYLKVQ